ncbi:MAG: hypothetical protein E7478_10060 [Ruminococcaceae bacterium]|nr:hypothetical protein [Oscillospiraceae bacterium]
MTRRLVFYAEKQDLVNIFTEFQQAAEVYYVPTYSDNGPVTISDFTSLTDLGIDHRGSHIGNRQLQVFPKSTPCVWREYQCLIDKANAITRHTSLTDENTDALDIDPGGVYKENSIFPTEINTMHYENSEVRRMFELLKRIVKKHSAKMINGYSICSKAYENRQLYRFCTIDIKSPPEYDLRVE